MSRAVPLSRFGGARALSAALISVAVALVGSSSARAAPGDLDLSFGSDGKVVTDVGSGSFDQAFAVAIQQDGKIITAGSTDTRGEDFALARYNADGSLDTSFGSAGKVVTDLGSNSVDTAVGVAVQADGKIVAAGRSRAAGSFDFALALVRYEADGSLDSGFGTGGKVLAQLGPASSDEAFGVEIQPDGKIVVAGISFTFGTGGGDFALVRFNADGTPDSGFGTGGQALTDFGSGSFDQARALAIQADGKLLAAGHSRAGGGLDFALVRHNPDGSVDAGFGTGGKVLTDVGSGSVDDAFAVAVQPDGKIVAAGSSDANGDDFALVRYNPDGSLDAGFGSGGKVLTDLRTGSTDTAQAVAIQADGRIVAAGLGGGDFAVARYAADGSLDSSFGADGKVLTSIDSGTFDHAYAVAIQADGKIVAAGTTQSLDNRDFAAVRYNAAAAADVTPPVITVPDSVTADATGPAGAEVAFVVSATDDLDGPVPVVCAPPSGATFPIGTTTVTCTASDSSGNDASASFDVHVKGAAEQLQDLIAVVKDLPRSSRLTKKLEAAAAALARGKVNKACKRLKSFIKQLDGESDDDDDGGDDDDDHNRLSREQAAELISAATRIRAVLGC